LTYCQAHLDYVDETANVAASYTQGQGGTDSDTESIADGQEVSSPRLQNLQLNNTSLEPSNGAVSSSTRSAGDMGPPNPVSPIPRSTDAFGSPLKRRKGNELKPSSSFGNQENDDPRSLPALSPAPSWLHLHSPAQSYRRPYSADGSLLLNENCDFGLTPLPLPDFIFDPTATLSSSLNRIKPASTALENVPSTPSYHPSPYSPNLHPPLEQSKVSSNNTWTWESPTLREAILMRYFTDNLAHWFDLCDPERHFQLVVPQRARRCAPLLNAIFTASARHLTRLPKYKVKTTIDGIEREVVAYAGNILSDLKVETAIQYHNESIKALIQLSMDPDQVDNEDLLAAAIILRFYEEVDSPLRVGIAAEDSNDEESDDVVDTELFLKVTNIFLNAQQPDIAQLPHSSPVNSLPTPGDNDSIDRASYPVFNASPSSMTTPPPLPTQHHHSASISASDPTPRVTRADGLRQACFWVAFRQEITVAFLKQRPFNFPLSRCAAFRSFCAAEDAVWADRLIIFCADVLRFCHGGADPDMPNPSCDTDSIAASPPLRRKKEERERWDELQSTLQKFSTVLPRSFEPIYFRYPNPAYNEVFPEIWYLDAIHVTGIQHVELARILLAVSNPYLPKLGLGHVAAMGKLSSELKSIVLRLCGIALSNRRTPPGLVTAYMGIAMCGEHFTERREQESLMRVLQELEREHAWPAERMGLGLRRAWGWE